MVRLVALIIGAGAALLFLVQPMAGKQVLPLLGGTPAAWITLMVVFQTALLAGYALAHGIAGQPMMVQRVVVLCLGGGALAMGVPDLGQGIPDLEHPALWLLRRAVAELGLPLLLLAMLSPLLQAWVARAGYANPYPLYAASNAGSLGGLLAYPVLVEPALDLPAQAQGFSAGVGVVLVGLLVLMLRRDSDHQIHITTDTAPLPTRPMLGTWVLRAALASGLLMAVTQHITTEMAPVPLLWVLPLGLYLSTFILVFSTRWTSRWHGRALRHTPIGLAMLVVSWGVPMPAAMGIVLTLVGLSLAVLGLHSLLATSRPAPAHLTLFYLCLSAGGALGGMVVALLAPVLFPARWEYPLLLLAASVTLGRGEGSGENPTPQMLMLLIMTVLMATLLALSPSRSVVQAVAIGAMLTFAGRMLWTFADRPLILAGILSCLLTVFTVPSLDSHVVMRDRSFFGALSVKDDPPVRRLQHGSTVHGMEDQRESHLTKPIAYYGLESGLGLLMRHRDGIQAVAAIGLGVGTLACHLDKDQRLTLFEIDPLVVRVATDPSLLQQWTACRPDEAVILVTDGRMGVATLAPHSQDLVVVDAFSSDAVPVHLLTREALEVYAAALKPDGAVLFHLSNRYLDLVSVAAKLAVDRGWTAWTRLHETGNLPHELDSMWVLLRPSADQGYPQDDPHWESATPAAGTPLWTDRHTPLLPVLLF